MTQTYYFLQFCVLFLCVEEVQDDREGASEDEGEEEAEAR